LREGVTVSRSTRAGGFTTIGANCFLMAYSHIAHDCVVGDRVLMAKAVLLAGHCLIGETTFLGGACALHQHTRIGEGTMVGGLAAITLDVPPFLMVADRNRVAGLNLVGLRRRGCAPEVVAELKSLFARVYAARNPRTEAAAALADGAARSAEGRSFLEFFSGGKRGVARPKHDGTSVASDEA
jgi:UDP-N-acetylglucosamine acyltransferase